MLFIVKWQQEATLQEVTPMKFKVSLKVQSVFHSCGGFIIKH